MIISAYFSRSMNLIISAARTHTLTHILPGVRTLTFLELVEVRLSRWAATRWAGVRGGRWRVEGERVSLSMLPSEVRWRRLRWELASIRWNIFITASVLRSSRDCPGETPQHVTILFLLCYIADTCIHV